MSEENFFKKTRKAFHINETKDANLPPDFKTNVEIMIRCYASSNQSVFGVDVQLDKLIRELAEKALKNDTYTANFPYEFSPRTTEYVKSICPFILISCIKLNEFDSNKEVQRNIRNEIDNVCLLYITKRDSFIEGLEKLLSETPQKG